MVRGADGKRLHYADLIENGERAARIAQGREHKICAQ